MEPPTKSQLKEYKHATKCHICFKLIRRGIGRKEIIVIIVVNTVELHTLDATCWIRYYPIFLLYSTGYDTHMFIKELAKHGSKMGVIAKNTEDYISFSVNVEVDKYIDKNGEECSKEITLRFIDSIKFMSSSLDSLVNNLARGGGDFFGFESKSNHQRELLIRKGIPCEYMDSWDRFEETTLPPASSFYSKLNMSGVIDQDYKHACKV